jgi:DNA-binding response OmpR family regulator
MKLPFGWFRCLVPKSRTAGCVDFSWPDQPPWTVLVVEDNPEYFDILAQPFRAGGFALFHARTGEEAVDVIRSEKPDVLVLDLDLLEQSEFHGLQQLIQQPGAQALPVLLARNRNPSKRLMRENWVDYARAIYLPPGPYYFTSAVCAARLLHLASMPRVEPSPTSRPDTTGMVAVPQRNMNSRRILVASAEQHILRLLELNLRKAGYEILTTRSRKETLEKSKSMRPGLMILDSFHDMSEYLVAREIKSDPATAATRIVMLIPKTAWLPSELAMPTTIGVETFLTKPFSPRELIRLLSKPSE